jgi:anti-sigma regulatory factor (Ser/Thr protein kinase)
MSLAPAPMRPSPGLKASDREAGRLFLALDDTLDAIEAGRVAIRAHIDPLGPGPMTTNRLEVVFEELISNIVRHGFEPGRGQSILVAVAATAEVVELVVEDDGRPFDPTQAPAPPPFESLETARIGGLGVATVRRFASGLRYEAAPPAPLRPSLAAPGFVPVNRLTVTLAAGR